MFVSTNEPGFTLSRAFHAAMPGVFGVSLAATDSSDFLDKQRITPSSLCFIFTRAGEIVAYPDEARMAAIVPQGGDIMVALPQLSDLKDPVATGLFAAYGENGTPGNLVYDVADRSYIGRVIEIPPRYGRDQLLGSPYQSTRSNSRPSHRATRRSSTRLPFSSLRCRSM